MESWLPVFVAVTALAVVLQMAILAAMYFQFRRTSERLTRIAGDLHARMQPILVRLQALVDDAQPRISSIVADASEITYLARSQAQKFDRVFTEAVDRLRLQLIRADQILTGALEAIAETGSTVRRKLWGPVEQASAFIKGVQVGLEVLRSHRRSPDRSEHEENLFI